MLPGPPPISSIGRNDMRSTRSQGNGPANPLTQGRSPMRGRSSTLSWADAAAGNSPAPSSTAANTPALSRRARTFPGSDFLSTRAGSSMLLPSFWLKATQRTGGRRSRAPLPHARPEQPQPLVAVDGHRAAVQVRVVAPRAEAEPRVVVRRVHVEERHLLQRAARDAA